MTPTTLPATVWIALITTGIVVSLLGLVHVRRRLRRLEREHA